MCPPCIRAFLARFLMGTEIKLDMADTSFQMTKKKVREQFCQRCFMWKPEEGFEPTGDICKDCREDLI
jgi:hypothetical protein